MISFLERIQEDVSYIREKLAETSEQLEDILLSTMKLAFHGSILCSFPLKTRKVLTDFFDLNVRFPNSEPEEKDTEAEKEKQNENKEQTEVEGAQVEKEEELKIIPFFTLLEKCQVKLWKRFLPEEDFYFENILALDNEDRWPLLWDPDEIAEDYLTKSHDPDGILRLKCQEKGFDLTSIVDAVETGKAVFLYEIKYLDSRLSHLYRKWIKEPGKKS